MLGKRHRPNLSRTASKPLLLSPHLGHGDDRADSRRVVIGFQLGLAENRNPNRPSSPEPNSCPASSHPNHGCAKASRRSPRSVLGSLLSASQVPPAAQGVGLGILAVIKAEEVVAAEAAAKGDAKSFLKSDPIAILGQSQYSTDDEGLANERTQYGSSPQRKKLNTDDEQDNEDAEFPGLAFLRGPSNGDEEDQIKEEEEEDDEEDDDDEDDDDDEEGFDNRKPIFSAASPASTSCSFGVQDAHFLSFCCLCKRSLSQGRDIYMYRGDQAFCSAECRYRQISVDDHKERLAATAANCATDCHSRALTVAPAAVA